MTRPTPKAPRSRRALEDAFGEDAKGPRRRSPGFIGVATALSLALSGCCFSVLTNGEVTGMVTDARTGAPIAGATVHPSAHSYGPDGAGEDVPSWTTDASGRYLAPWPCDYADRSVYVSAEGYEPRELPQPFPDGCTTAARATRDAALVPHP